MATVPVGLDPEAVVVLDPLPLIVTKNGQGVVKKTGTREGESLNQYILSLTPRNRSAADVHIRHLLRHHLDDVHAERGCAKRECLARRNRARLRGNRVRRTRDVACTGRARKLSEGGRASDTGELAEIERQALSRADGVGDLEG